MSVPLWTLAERASADSAPRDAAKLMELDGLAPAGALRTAALEIADPGNGSNPRREFLDVSPG